MGKSKGPYKACRFCPQCGVEALEKDRYMEAQSFPYAEYLCRICGFGFRIQPSKRVEHALDLFRKDRKTRVGKIGDNVTEENKQKFCELYPHGE